jgi:hypothetical protein
VEVGKAVNVNGNSFAAFRYAAWFVTRFVIAGLYNGEKSNG